jgi:hypothetical protein
VACRRLLQCASWILMGPPAAHRCRTHTGHWGADSPIGCHANDDGSACPSANWCPFNWYRTSGDINSSPDSWYKNLQTVVPYTQLDRPLSRPSCYAYPDMLEVAYLSPGHQLADRNSMKC